MDKQERHALRGLYESFHPTQRILNRVQALKLLDQIEMLEGALADIALSDDMTLEIARNKAKRIYEESSRG